MATRRCHSESKEPLSLGADREAHAGGAQKQAGALAEVPGEGVQGRPPGGNLQGDGQFQHQHVGEQGGCGCLLLGRAGCLLGLTGCLLLDALSIGGTISERPVTTRARLPGSKRFKPEFITYAPRRAGIVGPRQAPSAVPVFFLQPP